MALSDRPFAPVSGAATVANQIPLNQQAAQAGPLPALQVITATTETVLLNPLNLATALVVPLSGDGTMEQTVFDLYSSGYIKTTSTTNLTVKVYTGTSTTVANNTLLGSSGTIAQNGTTGTPVVAAWFAHARLIYDSVSGVLAGDIEFYVNKTKVAGVTLSNFPTGISNTAIILTNFLLTVTSSGAASGTPTTVNVQKFSVG